MDILEKYNIFIGNVAGFLQEYTPDRKVYHLQEEQKSCQITSLSWGRVNQEMLIGYQDGQVKLFNILTGDCETVVKQECSPVIGIAPYVDDLLIATKSGNIYHLTCTNSSLLVSNTCKYHKLETMMLNPYDFNQIVYGGVGITLTMYDVEQKAIVFTAKSDRHDALQLAQPCSFQAFHIFKDGKNVGAVTKEGQIRIYDVGKQRRAVMRFQRLSSVYNTISACDDVRILAGTNTGHLQLFDIRSHLTPVKTFRGVMGAIADIGCDFGNPIVASCSMDRYFRIHDLEEEEPKYIDYMKIQPTRMLFRRKHYVLAPVKQIREEDEESGANYNQEFVLPKKKIRINIHIN